MPPLLHCYLLVNFVNSEDPGMVYDKINIVSHKITRTIN